MDYRFSVSHLVKKVSGAKDAQNVPYHPNKDSSRWSKRNTVRRDIVSARRLGDTAPRFSVSFQQDGPAGYVHEARPARYGLHRRPPCEGQITAMCESEIPQLFREKKQNRETLSDALVLTAGDGVVEAGSCQHLMEKKFGAVGLRLLQHVEAALDSEDRTSGCARMTVRIVEDYIAITNHDAETVLVSALLWLCLAVRKPRAGHISESTAIHYEDDGCELFDLNELRPLDSSSCAASCWFPLFQSAVIALEPSEEDLPKYVWLQVDFATLVQLAAVEYAVGVKSGIILLGYSTALIPIKMLDTNILLWHLESEDLETLKSKTARVGWCRKSNVLLGTAALLQSSVGWSTGATKKKTWKWNGTSIQSVATTVSPLQLGFQGSATFERVSNILRFDVSRNYLAMLSSSYREAIILYDVGAKRAWLVPRLSVLHHMAIAYCSALRGAKEPLSVPLAKEHPNGGIASLKALRQSGSIQIERGGDDLLTLRELLMGFSVNLAKISPHRARHSKISGYEFMDIVHELPTTTLKRVHIQNEGSPWTSLLEWVPCLFCSNLGDAIIGVSSPHNNPACSRLATGKDYLAASVHCINNFSLRQGQTDNILSASRDLPGGLTWKPTDRVMWWCDHLNEAADEYNNCWNDPQFLQQISVKRADTSTNVATRYIDEDGAVVFGEGKRRVFHIF
ncbi:hypothetical protein BDW72DRAFT_197854 [Aspergillus terricola var. indicus]